MSDVRINPLFAGLGMARLIRETAGRFMRTGIALRICNLADADEPSLKEGDVCGVQGRRFRGGRREPGRRRNGGRLYPRRLNARPFDAEHREQALGNLVVLLDEAEERDAGIDAHLHDAGRDGPERHASRRSADEGPDEHREGRPACRAVATAAPPSIMTVENTDWPMLLAISTGSIRPDATR